MLWFYRFMNDFYTLKHSSFTILFGFVGSKCILKKNYKQIFGNILYSVLIESTNSHIIRDFKHILKLNKRIGGVYSLHRSTFNFTFKTLYIRLAYEMGKWVAFLVSLSLISPCNRSHPSQRDNFLMSCLHA